MSSRAFERLHPDMGPRVLKFLALAKEAGLTLLVTCTSRSNAEQALLYAQGRTRPGRILTRASPGQSAHNFMIGKKPASKAVDVVPLLHGKPVWDEKSPLWALAGQAGESAGLE